MKPDQFSPANNWMLVYLCERPDIKKADGSELIVLPDGVKAFTNWAEVVKVGPKCKWVNQGHIGCLCVLPTFSADMKSMRSTFDEEGWWLVRETAIEQFLYQPE